MGYANRRYRVIDGKLAKRWDAPGDGWFLTKAEAWADAEAKAKTFAANNARRESAKKQREAKAAKTAAAAEPKAKKAEAKKAPAGNDYENWKMPQLRSEMKARTGKGPAVGITKIAVIEKLRDLDADATAAKEAVADPQPASAPSPADIWQDAAG